MCNRDARGPNLLALKQHFCNVNAIPPTPHPNLGFCTPAKNARDAALHPQNPA